MNGWENQLDEQPAMSDMAARRTAQGLAWFSIGLGTAQLMMPGLMARCVGAANRRGNRRMMRALGMREMACGMGMLAQPSRAGMWAWCRAAGDMMDLALLAACRRSGSRNPGRTTDAGAMVAAAAVMDAAAAMRMGTRAAEAPAAAGRHVHTSVTVSTGPEEAYRYWHDFENLPSFMSHVQSVTTTGSRRSHWAVRAPAGRLVEWDAEMVADTPNQMIAWRSAQGAGVPNSGWVRFMPAPGGRGTEVTVDLDYVPPGGALGAAVARLFSEAPEQQVRDDLRRFKQVMETGEVVRSEGTPGGHNARAQAHQLPAQARGENS